MDWEIIGHQWAVNLLAGHIKGDALRHAYLIIGPMSIGRRTLALRFIQALNCPQTSGDGAPCLSCHTCQRIEKMEHPDLFPVSAGEDSLDIKVDQIRDLIHNLSLSNYEAPYRVALLMDFDDANDAAANALLKTLEEPPPQVVLVLTAENADTLLETIVSRCEEIHLRPLPIPDIKEGLSRLYQLPPSRANLLAHLSGGRPGYAIQLHQRPQLFAQREQWLDDLTRLLGANRVQRFAYANKYRQDADSLRAIIRVWRSYWRDILHRTSGAETSIYNIDRREEIDSIARTVDPQGARSALASLDKALHHIESYANTQLTAEILLLDLPKIQLSE